MKNTILKSAFAALLIPTFLSSCQPKCDAGLIYQAIDGNGIVAKKLTEGERQGKKYVEISYELDESIENFGMSVSSSWNMKGSSSNQRVDSTSSYVSCSINSAAKTVTVTKLNDFDDYIYVMMYLTDIPTVYAEIKIGLKQQFNGWDYDEINENLHYSISGQITSSTWSGDEAKHGIGSDFVSQYGTGFSSVYTDELTEDEKLPYLSGEVTPTSNGMQLYLEDSQTPVPSSINYSSEIYDYFVCEQGVSSNRAIKPWNIFEKDAGSDYFCSVNRNVYSLGFQSISGYFSASEKASIANAEYITLKVSFVPHFACARVDGLGVIVALALSFAPAIYQSYFL